MVAKMIMQTSNWLKGFVLLGMMLVSPVNALDNPDTPDYIGEFQAREQQYLKEIDNPNNTTLGFSGAYEKYQIFLDRELNIDVV